MQEYWNAVSDPIVSIVTVAYNAADTIRDTVESVLSQDYKNIEYVVIDGGSTDGTLAVLNGYEDLVSVLVSEPDAGVYDAMNKGLQRASGDILGYLNADDVLDNNAAIRNIAKLFREQRCDVSYGDLAYVARQNTRNIVRFWRAGRRKVNDLRSGWIPPHPTFYAKTELFRKHGGFDCRYQLAADYDLMLRILQDPDIKICYLAQILVRMRLGGITNNRLRNVVKQNLEILDYAKRNQLSHSRPVFMCKRIGWKLSQYLERPVSHD